MEPALFLPERKGRPCGRPIGYRMESAGEQGLLGVLVEEVQAAGIHDDGDVIADVGLVRGSTRAMTLSSLPLVDRYR